MFKKASQKTSFSARKTRQNTERKRSLLEFQRLEDRQLLAADIIVSNLTDNFNGNTTNIATLIVNDGGDGISLREAIAAANTTAGHNTIGFSPSLNGTIQLKNQNSSGAFRQEFGISESLTIEGETSAGLTSRVTIDAGGNSRIFNVDRGLGSQESITVKLENLILTNGETTGDTNVSLFDPGVGTFSGGAIRHFSSDVLTLSNVKVTDSHTEGDNARGGGIFSTGVVVLTNNSEIKGNWTEGTRAIGGGVFASSISIKENSAITENYTEGDFSPGGGVAALTTVYVDSATVSNNYTEGNFSYGGGIYSGSDRAFDASVPRSASIAGVTIQNSTVELNYTTGTSADGGGIHGTNVSLIGSMIRGNYTTGNNAEGGGISTPGLLDIRSATLDANSARGGVSPAAEGACNFGFGLLTELAGEIPILGAAAGSLITLIVANNQPCDISDNTGSGGGGAHADEITATGASVFSGNYTTGVDAPGGALRANSVTLVGSTFNLNRTVNDRSPGGAVSAQYARIEDSTFLGNTTGTTSIFTDGFFSAGGAVSANTAMIYGSHFSDNRTLDDGSPGGAVSAGELYVFNSVFLRNETEGGTQTDFGNNLLGSFSRSATSRGGAIYGKTVGVHNSTFADNRSSESGGAAAFSFGKISNSSFVGNHSEENGGAIYVKDRVRVTGIGHRADSFVDIVNTTITGNTSDEAGGGIYRKPGNADSKLVLSNSLVVGNAADDGANELNIDGSIILANNNITEITLAVGINDIFSETVSYVFEGAIYQRGVLRDNGGRVETVALRNDGSNPALDAAIDTENNLLNNEQDPKPGEAPDQDARGFNRAVDLEGINHGAIIDLGAFEVSDALLVNSALEFDNNDATTTLREAILVANATTSVVPNIRIDESLANGSISLNTNLALAPDAPILTKSTIITGPSGEVTITGSTNNNIFTFTPNVLTDTSQFLKLENLVLTNGSSTLSGGAIRTESAGKIILDNTRLSSNRTVGDGARGGAVFAPNGTVELRNSILRSNRTVFPNSAGGAISASAVHAYDSFIEDNRTVGLSSPGGAIDAGVVRLGDTTVIDNNTSRNQSPGGGIYAHTEFTSAGSIVFGNRTSGIGSEGGGVSTGPDASNLVLLTTFQFNSTRGDYSGGGAMHGGGDNVILASRFYNNYTEGDQSPGGALSLTTLLSNNLLIQSSAIESNRTLGDLSPGGGLSATGTVLSVIGSNISNNSTEGLLSSGGGAFVDGLFLISSTVAGNRVDIGFGGGVAGLLVSAQSSTITGNFAGGAGGGISGKLDDSVNVTLQNSVVLGNGGLPGAQHEVNVNSLTLEGNNIVGQSAATFDISDFTPIGSGTVTNANPVAVFESTEILSTDVGTGVTQPVTAIHPVTGATEVVLRGGSANNGGLSSSVALKHDILNPAVDSGDASLLPPDTADLDGDGNTMEPIPTDARGADRVNDLGGSAAAAAFLSLSPSFLSAGVVFAAASSSGGLDVGSFEVQTTVVEAKSLIVTTLDDRVFAYDGVTSLREAIQFANDPTAGVAGNGDADGDGSTHDTIQFDASLADGTIALKAGDLPISDSLTIEAGPAGHITIDAVADNLVSATDGSTSALADSRILTFTATTGNLTIDGLTLTNGHVEDDNGGAIRFDSVTGTLRLVNSVVSNSSTLGDNAVGGGVFSAGDLVVSKSAIYGNSTDGSGAKGGGVYAMQNAQIVNSTISKNVAEGINATGGGVHTAGTLHLSNATVTDNESQFAGGGVYAASATIGNSIVLRNQTSVGETEVDSPSGVAGFTFQGNNIIGEFSTDFNPIEGVVSNAVFTDVFESGALVDAGGSTPTLVLKPLGTNPALDAGPLLVEGLIRPTVVTTNTTGDFRPVENLIGSAGLTLDNFDATLEPDVNNSWVTGGVNPDYFENGGTAPVLTFDLGETVDLTDVAIWGYKEFAGNDVKAFTLEFSTDGGATFGQQVTLTKPIYTAAEFIHTLPLGGTFSANTVRMTITDNHNGDRVGFQEIRFVGNRQSTDQRGMIRNVDLSGLTGTNQVDLGAYEIQSTVQELPSLIVTTEADVDDPFDFVTSLREAIDFADVGGDADNDGSISDTIRFQNTGVLSSLQVNSELVIDSPLTIDGPGANLLTIDATGSNSRVFHVSDSNSATDLKVTIRGLTLMGGSPTGGNLDGGAVLNSESLTLDQTVITNNMARSGGGIQSFGNLTLVDSTVSDNTASVSGGGINVATGSSGTLVRSELVGNMASYTGGGINVNGAISIYDSLIANNESSRGGGVNVLSSDSLTMHQTTVAGNEASGIGGGIANLGQLSFSSIINSTFTGNRADSDGDGTGQAGGVFDNFSTLSLHNTIVAGNFKGTGISPNDVDSGLGADSSFNLVGTALSFNALTDGVNGNIIGVGGSGTIPTSQIFDQIDPSTGGGLLAENGGSTRTANLKLAPDNPAIDAGSDSFLVIVDEAVVTDANRTIRVTDFPNLGGNGTNAVDIGAVESDFDAAAVTPTVTNVVRDEGGVLARPDLWSTLTVVFDADVVVAAGDLSLFNDSLGGTAVDLSGIGFGYVSSTATATWDFSTLAALDAAFYTYQLDAGSITSGGQSLDGNGDGTGGDDFVDQLYVALPGDANLDGKVDVLGDAFTLVGNLGTTGGATWAQGDFNGDGNVSVLGDAFILVGKLGQDVRPVNLAASSTSFATIQSQSTSVATNGPAVMALPLEHSSEADEQDDSINDGSPTLSPLMPTQLVLAGDHDLRDDVFGSDF